MGRTYEALMKAEKSNHIRSEEIKVFDIKKKPKVIIPTSYSIPPNITEEYHRMKYKLIDALPDSGNKALLFSCPTGDEGTTSTLLGFAITLANTGEKVLLVDANVRNPCLHNVLNVEKNYGLTELLSGQCSLNEVIKKSKIDNISIITAGIVHSNPISLFESESFGAHIDQMKTQSPWILFDSPPVISYIDSSVMASKMNGVVLILRAEKTRSEVAQSAKERIELGHGKILGVILNRRKMYIPQWAYNLM
jgi:protein-tyrosine kinase